MKADAPQDICKNCRNATSVGYRGTDTNYFICSYKKAWEYQAATYPCDIGRFWPRLPIEPVSKRV